MEEDISRLHRRVAKHVTENMNKHYQDLDKFDPGLHKTRDLSDFAKVAKRLCHDLRAKIKESYEAYNNGSVEGISLTGDHVVFIETEARCRGTLSLCSSPPYPILEVKWQKCVYWRNLLVKS